MEMLGKTDFVNCSTGVIFLLNSSAHLLHDCQFSHSNYADNKALVSQDLNNLKQCSNNSDECSQLDELRFVTLKSKVMLQDWNITEPTLSTARENTQR